MKKREANHEKERVRRVVVWLPWLVFVAYALFDRSWQAVSSDVGPVAILVGPTCPSGAGAVHDRGFLHADTWPCSADVEVSLEQSLDVDEELSASVVGSQSPAMYASIAVEDQSPHNR